MTPAAGPAIAIAVTSAVYGVGVRSSWRRAGTGRGIRRWQVLSFAAGIGALLVALVSPVDALADDLFAAHMAQHVLLAIVAPPFLVAGAPMLAGLWSLPRDTRVALAGTLRRSGVIAGSWRALTEPVVACALQVITLCVWHIPRPYVAALEHPSIHALEHLSFVASGSLVWWSILNPRRGRRAAYGIGIGVLFVTMLLCSGLGALIALSHRVWYPLQARGAAGWELTALEDQQLAGLIMWVPGGFLYLIAAAVVFIAWLRAGDAKEVLGVREPTGVMIDRPSPVR